MEKKPITNQEILNYLKAYLTLRDLVPKTIKSYITMTSMFLNWCDKNHINVNMIEIPQIFSYCLYLKKERQYAAKTFNSNMSVLRFVLTHVLKFPVDKTVIPNAKVDTVIPEVFTQEEIITFIDQVRELKYQTIFMLLYSCGLRVSEACALTYNDISRKNMTVHISKSKNRTDRYVPLSDMILKTLTLYWKKYGKPMGYLFPSKSERGYISNSSVNAVLKKVVKELNWEHRKISSHIFRRSCGTHLYESGHSLLFIKDYLGHKVLSSTLVYIRPSFSKENFVNPYDRAFNKYGKGGNHNGK